MMTIKIPTTNEKIARSSRVFSTAFDRGMETKAIIDIMTLPGEKSITRQTVFGYRQGLNKPLTDRLLDVYAYSESETARQFAISVLKAIWPEIEFTRK